MTLIVHHDDDGWNTWERPSNGPAAGTMRDEMELEQVYRYSAARARTSAQPNDPHIHEPRVDNEQHDTTDMTNDVHRPRGRPWWARAARVRARARRGAWVRAQVRRRARCAAVRQRVRGRWRGGAVRVCAGRGRRGVRVGKRWGKRCAGASPNTTFAYDWILHHFFDYTRPFHHHGPPGQGRQAATPVAVPRYAFGVGGAMRRERRRQAWAGAKSGEDYHWATTAAGQRGGAARKGARRCRKAGKGAKELITVLTTKMTTLHYRYR